SDGALRIAVDDQTWQLTVESGTAHCTPTADPPELRMPRAALGSLYLGGISASRLARADRVDGDAAALAAADRLFGWAVAPWCPEVF
ncbi:MAG: sterol carrier protein domain-containing protein, partial [bacterium]